MEKCTNWWCTSLYFGKTFEKISKGWGQSTFLSSARLRDFGLYFDRKEFCICSQGSCYFWSSWGVQVLWLFGFGSHRGTLYDNRSAQRRAIPIDSWSQRSTDTYGCGTQKKRNFEWETGNIGASLSTYRKTTSTSCTSGSHRTSNRWGHSLWRRFFCWENDVACLCTYVELASWYSGSSSQFVWKQNRAHLNEEAISRISSISEIRFPREHRSVGRLVGHRKKQLIGAHRIGVISQRLVWHSEIEQKRGKVIPVLPYQRVRQGSRCVQVARFHVVLKGMLLAVRRAYYRNGIFQPSHSHFLQDIVGLVIFRIIWELVKSHRMLMIVKRRRKIMTCRTILSVDLCHCVFCSWLSKSHSGSQYQFGEQSIGFYCG